jgi:antirestriction protein ArdC
LNRDHSGSFGSKLYANEELVAELTAAFVCATLSIKPTVRHADYLGSWLKILREDSRAIFRAASKASKACDFLLAFSAVASATDDAGPSREAGSTKTDASRNEAADASASP